MSCNRGGKSINILAEFRNRGDGACEGKVALAYRIDRRYTIAERKRTGASEEARLIVGICCCRFDLFDEEEKAGQPGGMR
jgi:hypothetical protein